MNQEMVQYPLLCNRAMAKATLVCVRARSYINVKDTLVEWVHEYSFKLHSAALTRGTWHVLAVIEWWRETKVGD